MNSIFTFINVLAACVVLALILRFCLTHLVCAIFGHWPIEAGVLTHCGTCKKTLPSRPRKP